MFFDFSFSDLTVEAIASDADPDLVTLDIAAEKTLNRSLFAALIAAVAAFACFAGLSGLRLAARHHALLAAINRSDAQPLATGRNRSGNARCQLHENTRQRR